MAYLAPTRFPAELLKRTGAVNAGFDSGPEALRVWVRRKGPSYFMPLRVKIRDSGQPGVEQTLTGSANFFCGNLSNETISCFPFPAFPRRGETMEFELIGSAPTEGATNQVIAIKNPVRKKYPNWRHATIPATRKVNGLEFVLKEFKGNVPAVIGEDSTGWTRAVFEVRENGRINHNWSLRDVSFTDPTGNQFIPHSTAHSWSQKGEIPWGFRGMLWRSEPVWKLRAGFRRYAGFPSNDLWTVRGIRVPAANERVVVTNKFSWGGSEFEMAGLVGQQVTLPMVSPNRDHLLLDIVTPNGSGIPELTFVKATDQTGREIRFPSLGAEMYMVGFGSSTPQTAGKTEFHLCFQLKLPPETKEVDITLGVQVPMYVEFLVPSEGQ